MVGLRVKFSDFVVDGRQALTFLVAVDPMEGLVSAHPNVGYQCVDYFDHAVGTIGAVISIYDCVRIGVRSEMTGGKLIPFLGEIAAEKIDPSDFRLFYQSAIDKVDVIVGIEFVSEERVHPMCETRAPVWTC